MRKITSFADPRLYALSVVTEHLSKSAQPLVPEHVFMSGGGSNDSSGLGMIGTLVNLLIAEKSGFHVNSAGNGKSPEPAIGLGEKPTVPEIRKT
jgi:hypothetical protein